MATSTSKRGLKAALLLLLLGSSALVAGFAVYQLQQPAPGSASTIRQSVGSPLATNSTGQVAPDFALPDVDGQMRRSNEWAEQILVVNFWATWCPPCLREIPTFIELQAELGAQNVQFIGIAIDDPAAVASFVKEHGMNYPVLVGQADAAAIGRDFGNVGGGLPYTALVDRSGTIRHTQLGELERDKAESWILPLLQPQMALSR